MKKKALAFTGFLIAAVLFAFSYLLPPKDKPVDVSVITADDSRAAAALEGLDAIPVPDLTGIVPGGAIRAKVVGITDGDTIKTEWDGNEYKVRLLCIDTPESVKKGVPVQPYGKEASERLTKLLLGKEVTLVFEKGVEDKYGRLLAYVILKDGTCVNAYMVAQGYARMDVVRPNTIHRDYFAKLQENAIKEEKGLWALPESKRPFVKNDKGYYIPRILN